MMRSNSRNKEQAKNQSVAPENVASELVRPGLEAPVQTPMVNGFHAVVLPANSQRVTSEKIKQLVDA